MNLDTRDPHPGWVADASGEAPAVVVWELIDDESGEELPPAAARAYAERNGLVYVEGASILERLG
jgi:3,4-dihydroxy 2-butanone 4-phosphate synthase